MIYLGLPAKHGGEKRMGTTQDTQRLGAELASAMPALNEHEQRVAIRLYRLLGEGRPVSRQDLAKRSSADHEPIGRLLDEHPGVYFDDRGRVVGFWGLALGGMPHRMLIDGIELYGWCAWDTLFL